MYSSSSFFTITGSLPVFLGRIAFLLASASALILARRSAELSARLFAPRASAAARSAAAFSFTLLLILACACLSFFRSCRSCCSFSSAAVNCLAGLGSVTGMSFGVSFGVSLTRGRPSFTFCTSNRSSRRFNLTSANLLFLARVYALPNSPSSLRFASDSLSRSNASASASSSCFSFLSRAAFCSSVSTR